MVMRLNRETGKYEAEASVKFWVGLLTTIGITVTALVTYTITLTLAFGSVRQDIALIKQQLELKNEADKLANQALSLRVSALENQRDALSNAVQANTDMLRLIAQQRGVR